MWPSASGFLIVVSAQGVAAMNSNSFEGYLKIGDVARKVGLSPSVIRSWESLGLTRPRRTASKYRLYSLEDVKLLKRARYLRRGRGPEEPPHLAVLKRERGGRRAPESNPTAV